MGSRPGGELSQWEIVLWGGVLEETVPVGGGGGGGACPGGESSGWEMSSGEFS